MGVRSRAGLAHGSWNSIPVCLLVCSAVYVATNLVLMYRSSELGNRRRTSMGAVAAAAEDDEDGTEEQSWWLPRPPGGLLSEENEVHIRHLLGKEWPFNNGSLLHRLAASQLRKALQGISRCDRVPGVEKLKYLTSGWTKAVYQGRHEDKDVAVKMVDRNGYDVRRCVKDDRMTSEQCVKKAEDKLLKEAFILRALDNPHIVRVFEVCVPSTSAAESSRGQVQQQQHSGPSIVTELGEIADIIKLLQMSWEDRLRLSFGLSKLLYYLSHSPYGSIVVNDFRRQQFVIVGGELKMIDVDDVGFDELLCSNDADCQNQLPTSNVSAELPCVSGRCVGLNEIKNIMNAGRHFMSVLLPHGTPTVLRPLVNEITDAHATATLRTHDLLELMTKLVQMYSQGLYLERTDEPVQTSYKKIDESDLPGQFDYRCRYSIASSGCTVSVFDQKEAEDLCDFDQQCQAFVISSQKSWTGRVFAHLKNNVSTPTHRLGTNLYVRQRS